MQLRPKHWLKSLSRRVASSLALMALAASPSLAATYCLDSGTSANVEHRLIVLKSFKRPPLGKCLQFAGYRGDGSIAIPAEVTACMNSFGTRLYLAAVIHTFAHPNQPYPNVFDQERLSFDFPYPSLSGAYVALQLQGGALSAAPIPDSSLARCTVFPMP